MLAIRTHTHSHTQPFSRRRTRERVATWQAPPRPRCVRPVQVFVTAPSLATPSLPSTRASCPARLATRRSPIACSRPGAGTRQWAARRPSPGCFLRGLASQRGIRNPSGGRSATVSQLRKPARVKGGIPDQSTPWSCDASRITRASEPLVPGSWYWPPRLGRRTGGVWLDTGKTFGEKKIQRKKTPQKNKVDAQDGRSDAGRWLSGYRRARYRYLRPTKRAKAPSPVGMHPDGG